MGIQTVKCNRMQFVPGDRLLVTVPNGFRPDQIDRVRRSVSDWAGGDVPVLVVRDSISVQVTRLEPDQKEHVWTP